MKMKILIIVMMMLLCMGLAYATAPVITLDSTGVLPNATYSTSSTVSYVIHVTGNQTSWDCSLFTTENGSSASGDFWTAVVTNATIQNNTNTTLGAARTSVSDALGATNYTWNVKCIGTTDVEGNWGSEGNYTFGVDATAPVVTVSTLYPNKNWYTTATNPRIALTANDTNVAQCVLRTNLNTTLSVNTTGLWQQTLEELTYTTATQFNFTRINSTNGWDDSADGSILWSYMCNDSAGNSVSGGNYTFFVDTTAPAAFDFNTTLWRTDDRLLTNESCTGCGSYTYLSMATDYTPQVGWTTSVETNFSRYELLFFPLTYGNTTGMINTTAGALDNSTLQVNTSILAADQKYAIRIIAYDLAGNSINSTTSAFEYGTDSTNRALKSGWNIVGNVGTNMTLSQIMNWTGATTTSIWNTSHEFVSHVSGGSNGAEVVPSGQPVLLYLSGNTNVSNWIWNTAANGGIDGPILNGAVNLTNQTADDWNLIMCKNITNWNFQQLDNLVNPTKASEKLNITYFSMYDNTASEGAKYVPFVANWTIKNDTTIEFGETMWMYIGQDVRRADGSVKLNWSVA